MKNNRKMKTNWHKKKVPTAKVNPTTMHVPHQTQMANVDLCLDYRLDL